MLAAPTREMFRPVACRVGRVESSLTCLMEKVQFRSTVEPLTCRMLFVSWRSPCDFRDWVSDGRRMCPRTGCESWWHARQWQGRFAFCGRHVWWFADSDSWDDAPLHSRSASTLARRLQHQWSSTWNRTGKYSPGTSCPCCACYAGPTGAGHRECWVSIRSSNSGSPRVRRSSAWDWTRGGVTYTAPAPGSEDVTYSTSAPETDYETHSPMMKCHVTPSEQFSPLPQDTVEVVKSALYTASFYDCCGTFFVPCRFLKSNGRLWKVSWTSLRNVFLSGLRNAWLTFRVLRPVEDFVEVDTADVGCRPWVYFCCGGLCSTGRSAENKLMNFAGTTTWSLRCNVFASLRCGGCSKPRQACESAKAIVENIQRGACRVLGPPVDDVLTAGLPPSASSSPAVRKAKKGRNKQWVVDGVRVGNHWPGAVYKYRAQSTRMPASSRYSRRVTSPYLDGYKSCFPGSGIHIVHHGELKVWTVGCTCVLSLLPHTGRKFQMPLRSQTIVIWNTT